MFDFLGNVIVFLFLIFIILLLVALISVVFILSTIAIKNIWDEQKENRDGN